MRRPSTWAAPWTTAEDAIVLAHYREGGVAACIPLLPGRSALAIMHRGQRLGRHTHRRWTSRDTAQLSSLWGVFAVETIARRMDRTPKAIYQRAKEMGLPLGVPRGMESLADSERRTGFDRSQIKRIAAWAGVEIRRTMSRDSKPRGKKARHAYRFLCVDPFDLDEAIERWHSTEAVESAARARGLIGETLRRWLVESGLTPPLDKRHWRVETALIDRVVAYRLAVFHKKKRTAVPTAMSA